MPPSIITDFYQGRARCTFNPGRHTYSIRIHGVVEKLFQPSCTGILQTKAKSALVNWAAKQSLAYVSKKLGEYESQQGAPPFTLDSREIHSWLQEAEEGWREEETATTIGSVAHRFCYEELKFRAGLSENRPRLPLTYDAVLMPEFTPAMVSAANSSVVAALQFFDDHYLEPVLLERPLWSPSEGYVGTPDFIGKIDGELCVADFKTSRKIYPEYRVQLACLQKMYQEEFPDQVIKKRWAINIPKDGSELQTEVYDLDTFSEDLEVFRACFTLYNFDRKNDNYKKGTPVQVLGDLDALVPRPI
jgi:hypothetical protein